MDAQIKQKIAHDIELYHWHAIGIPRTDPVPEFIYTIGLQENFSHPEITIFGLPYNSGHRILAQIAEEIKNGGRIETGKEYVDHFIDGYAVTFLKVNEANYSTYFSYAAEYYAGRAFAMLQMVWPDREGRFPWDENFDKSLKQSQPLLDRNIEFQFYEEKNLGIYTTKQVIEENLPILDVYHEMDGDWQFLCGTTEDVADLKIVALAHLVKTKPELNELFDLPRGWRAYRDNPDQDWIREQYQHERN